MYCTNLVKCPICDNADNLEMVTYELSILYEIRCNECLTSYGETMESKGTLDNGVLSSETIKRASVIWQKGACDSLNIDYIECEFTED